MPKWQLLTKLLNHINNVIASMAGQPRVRYVNTTAEPNVNIKPFLDARGGHPIQIAVTRFAQIELGKGSELIQDQVLQMFAVSLGFLRSSFLFAPRVVVLLRLSLALSVS